jgi:hypothetical protein
MCSCGVPECGGFSPRNDRAEETRQYQRINTVCFVAVLLICVAFYAFVWWYIPE